jgi:hypothetical protein
VYDEAALDAAMPYAQIGDDAFLQDDSHDVRGWIGAITIEVWDAITAGRSGIKGVLNEISTVLHAGALSVDGYTVNYIRYEQSGTSRSDERPIYRGFITFQIRLQLAGS